MLPVTAAVTGLGTAAVKTAADFDSSMSNVAAISGSSAEDMDKLRERAREMEHRQNSLQKKPETLWDTWQWPGGMHSRCMMGSRES